jgi:uncharacterized membrane protein
MASPSYWRSHARCRFAAIAGCLLAIAGFKFLLIARVGSPTPYMDQWVGEAISLYLPYFSNTLTFDHMVALPNEHRFVLTRVAWLALLIVNGTWDPILQMQIGAMVHVMAIGCLLAGLGRVLELNRLILLLGFALLFCAVPFGWDNTLMGYNLHFYLLLLLSMLSLFLLARAPAWSPQWLLASLLATLGYFSFAPGSLILPATIATALMQIAVGQRRSARELAGIVAHAAIAMVLIYDVQTHIPPSSAVSHLATSIGEFSSTLMATASWPVAGGKWPVALQIVPAALVQAPILVLIVQMVRQRPGISDPRWFYVAIAAWVALQLIAVSFARAGDALQSRYTDNFLIGTILNFAALLLLIGDRVEPQRRKLLIIGAAVWIFAVMLGAGQKAGSQVIDGVSFRYANGQRQTENVRTFLATGDYAALDKKPESLDIPFPSGAVLRELLTNPALRAILPPELTGEKPHRPLRDAVLTHGPMLIPIGLALLLIVAMAWLANPARDEGDHAVE